MNCEKAQNLFLETDNRSTVSLSVQLHMLFCPQCRRRIRTLNEQFASLLKSAPFIMTRDLSDEIMRNVFLSDVRYEHNIGVLKWTVAGLVILLSMVCIPFSDSFGWLRRYFGRGLELPVSIVLGVIMSIYASVAIFSKMEELKKFIHIFQRKLH
ncbi:MAG: hypothetical protein A2W19_16615 [Spirochaetes bacterium RBG_16_49_21]|nr:MAG: hypothetical protein A2W19_16615 [Spirochaetes bacterium RBG_16_49_21]